MLFIFVMQNQKAKNDISTSNNNNNEEEEEEHDSYTSTQTTPHGVSRLIDRLLSTSYHALHSVSSIGLQFNAIYGPRGFGVPSTLVPIFHESRKRRCEFGGNAIGVCTIGGPMQMRRNRRNRKRKMEKILVVRRMRSDS